MTEKLKRPDAIDEVANSSSKSLLYSLSEKEFASYAKQLEAEKTELEGRIEKARLLIRKRRGRSLDAALSFHVEELERILSGKDS